MSNLQNFSWCYHLRHQQETNTTDFIRECWKDETIDKNSTGEHPSLHPQVHLLGSQTKDLSPCDVKQLFMFLKWNCIY